MRIYLGQLQRGAFVIRRRSAAWNIVPTTPPPSVQFPMHPPARSSAVSLFDMWPLRLLSCTLHSSSSAKIVSSGFSSSTRTKSKWPLTQLTVLKRRVSLCGMCHCVACVCEKPASGPKAVSFEFELVYATLSYPHSSNLFQLFFGSSFFHPDHRHCLRAFKARGVAGDGYRCKHQKTLRNRLQLHFVVTVTVFFDLQSCFSFFFYKKTPFAPSRNRGWLQRWWFVLLTSLKVICNKTFVCYFKAVSLSLFAFMWSPYVKELDAFSCICMWSIKLIILYCVAFY